MRQFVIALLLIFVNAFNISAEQYLFSKVGNSPQRTCLRLENMGILLQEKSNEKPKEEPKPALRERFVFGGNMFFQAGTYTMFNISPMAGFYFTPRLFGGTSVTYQYFYEKWLNTKISSHIFGTSIFTQYAILNHIGKDLPIKSDFSIISHIEYEILNLDRDFSDSQKKLSHNRYWMHGILVGGGLKQHFGKRSSINISILYNLLWDSRTPYTNPLLRLGVYL